MTVIIGMFLKITAGCEVLMATGTWIDDGHILNSYLQDIIIMLYLSENLFFFILHINISQKI